MTGGKLLRLPRLLAPAIMRSLFSADETLMYLFSSSIIWLLLGVIGSAQPVLSTQEDVGRTETRVENSPPQRELPPTHVHVGFTTGLRAAVSATAAGSVQASLHGDTLFVVSRAQQAWRTVPEVDQLVISPHGVYIGAVIGTRILIYDLLLREVNTKEVATDINLVFDHNGEVLNTLAVSDSGEITIVPLPESRRAQWIGSTRMTQGPLWPARTTVNCATQGHKGPTCPAGLSPIAIAGQE
jgi:hypothetical protein